MKWNTSHTSADWKEIKRERKEFPLGGGPHTFTFTISMRGCGCDYSSDMVYVVKANDLKAAIQQVSDRPFEEWMNDMVAEEKDGEDES